MVELRSGQVILRALEREHCHRLWEQNEIDIDQPTETFQPGLARENADQWFDEIQAKQGKTGVDFGIFGLDGNILGHVQLHSIDWQHRSAEIGLGLASREHRGKGYGTHATQLVVQYAFDHLGLHRLMANPVAFNQAGIRVLEKCGFTQEGPLRDAFFFGGLWHDRLLYSLLEPEYRQAL